jgi:hypothetical protein
MSTTHRWEGRTEPRVRVLNTSEAEAASVDSEAALAWEEATGMASEVEAALTWLEAAGLVSEAEATDVASKAAAAWLQRRRRHRHGRR